jgi:hypothetical protein
MSNVFIWIYSGGWGRDVYWNILRGGGRKLKKGAGVAKSVYGLATDSTTGRSRFNPRQRQKIFPLTSMSRPALRAHPASCTVGTGGPFPGGKVRPGRDGDHSSPSSAEVVNE